MLPKVDISKVLFLDIECVSGVAHYEQLPENFQKFWKHKAKFVLKKEPDEMEPEELEASFRGKAAIYAEFGKIVCISVGVMVRNSDQSLSLRLKSFAEDDEAKLLKNFSDLINQYYNDPTKHYFCGHNIKEFDIPYICRRLLVNGLPLPDMLQLAGKKPWETNYLLDTLELWRFGDYKHYTSLGLLTALFGIPTPKDDIDGSEVGRVYWEDEDLPRIAVYCEKDVLATVQLFLRLKGQALLEAEQITSVT